MQNTSDIERTDLASCRLVAATRSLMGWFTYQRTRLATEKRLFMAELHRTFDPYAREELVRALDENALESRRLEAHWDSSSLLNRMRNGTSETRERRLIQQKTAGPSGLPGRKVTRSSDGGSMICGFAAVYDKPSQDLGGFDEVIQRGAFEQALKTSDCRAAFNHSPDLLLGRQTAGTLRLEERREGLWFEVDVNRDWLGDYIIGHIRRGDLGGCSFSFILAKGGDEWQPAPVRGGKDRRIIKSIGKLFDVGPVTFPAYEDTSVGLAEPFELVRVIPKPRKSQSTRDRQREQELNWVINRLKMTSEQREADRQREGELREIEAKLQCGPIS